MLQAITLFLRERERERHRGSAGEDTEDRGGGFCQAGGRAAVS